MIAALIYRGVYHHNFFQENHFMTLDNFCFRVCTGVVLVVCLFLTGCGSGNVKVTGNVTYSDNGEPVKSGTVVFSSEQVQGRGTIKDGKYSVGLMEDGDGVPPGTYTVASNSYPMPNMSTPTTPGGDTLQNAPPDREVYYTKEPLTVDVQKSMTIDFSVERGVRK